MYEGPIQTLIDELGRLPGVGPKSAQRIAFHILTADKEEVARLVARTPLGRAVAVADLVSAALFLAANRSITGQVLAVDAGRSAV